MGITNQGSGVRGQESGISLSPDSCLLTPDSKASLPRVLYVLNVNPADKFGSMEEQIVILARAFQDQGSSLVPLFTFAPEPGSTDCLLRHGVEAHCLDLLHFRLAT